jgi:hypothetical protein
MSCIGHDYPGGEITERDQRLLLDLANNLLHRTFIMKFPRLSHERGLKGIASWGK